jgi:parallel beta-helix repeat protein
MKPVVKWLVAVGWIAAVCGVHPAPVEGQQPKDSPEITPKADNVVVERSVRVKRGVYVVADSDGNGVIQVKADDVVIDFQGATLVGVKNPAAGEKDKFEGYGVAVKGHKNVVIKNAKIHGYQYNIRATGCTGLKVEDCDLSHSRGERISRQGRAIDIFLGLRELDAWQRYGAGAWLEKCTDSRVTRVRATGAQNGVLLAFCEKCTVHDNDVAFNSGWGVGLWESSRNVVSWNRADFCNRPGEGSWGEDSAAVALVNSSHHNFVVGNSLTHSGDGFFLTDGANMGVRPSDDNVVAHNDGSWSPHNAFESTFSVRNVFYKNTATDSDYGFWMSFSSENLVAENRVERNATDGINIGSGARNQIEKNTLVGNRQVAIHVYTEPPGPDVVASRDSVVVDNVIKDSKLAFSLEHSTNTFLGGNKLEKAALPAGVGQSDKNRPGSQLATFLDSRKAKRVENIVKTKPKGFKMFRDQQYKPGLHLLQLDDFAPRDFRTLGK